ncbi:MAG: helix-turn-helix transcriptional regulator [Nocardioidaceae bacterium]
MASPSGRLLTLLSLLQTPREWTGSELSERLRVSARTIRRDVDRLRELGYPVEATRGVVGGYRLGAGAVMPPLLLDPDEAVAVAVSLRTAAVQAVDGIDEPAVRALTKLQQVLPSRLRHRVRALAAATERVSWDRPASGVDTDLLAVIAMAAANRERLRFDYEAADGQQTRRLLEPHKLVASGRRWYLVGWDTDRDDWRLFRLDRMARVCAVGTRAPVRELPAADAAAFVRSRISDLRATREVRVVLSDPSARVVGWLARSAALEELGGGRQLLRTEADSMPMMAARILSLGCDFEVLEPDELVGAIRAIVQRATRALGEPGVATDPR